ncbi:hypothetical protein N9724_28245, partial [Klebsiella pneumoniae]
MHDFCRLRNIHGIHISQKNLQFAEQQNHGLVLGVLLTRSSSRRSTSTDTRRSLSRTTLRMWWAETTWQMQRLRDNPACADQEHEA